MRFSRSAGLCGLSVAALCTAAWSEPIPPRRPLPSIARTAVIPREETLSSRIVLPESSPGDPFIVADRDDVRPGSKETALSAGTETRLVWESRHRSGQNRPIETAVLGTGHRRVAVLSSVHGNETQSLTLVAELARQLAADPDQIAGQTVLIVRTPNPDGLQAASAFNARGVDLNRNFPSNNWKLLPRNRGGARVASEAETRALVQILEEFRPELLIHVKDTGEDSLINAEGEIREKAETIAEQHHWREAHDLGQITSGSIENYARTRLQCHALTLLVKREGTPGEAWDKNRPLLFSVLDDLTAAPHTATTTRRRAGQPASSRTSLPDDADAEFPRRTQSRLDVDSGSTPGKGYVELPSP